MAGVQLAMPMLPLRLPTPMVIPMFECREESGRLTDGRHFKRFFLIPAGGGGAGDSSGEKLVVTGVDSIRKDRRCWFDCTTPSSAFACRSQR